jgi:hypothetical protein
MAKQTNKQSFQAHSCSLTHIFVPPLIFVLAVIYYSVEALSESLSEWGEEDGAIVVISHDKNFCDKVGFTHVATITTDGSLTFEQRNPGASDWDSSGATLQRSSSSNESETNNNEDTKNELNPQQRKQAYNAPKRIAKIEDLVEQKEKKMAALDAEMLANGRDVEKLVDLTKAKDVLEEQVMELMEEWEELETLMAQIA